MKLLAIDSSILSKASVSRKLTSSFVNQWQRVYPETEVIYRDLHAQPVNHLSQKILAAAQAEPAQLSSDMRDELDLSSKLIAELFSADVLVIGAPMYNFSIPSQLKAWIDRVLVAGKTFKYIDGKVQGLLTGKRAFIISSRGGIYSEGPAVRLDHQESYVTSVLKFIGIEDITFIRAEGVNMGEPNRTQALNQAENNITQLLQLKVA